jgi:non-lysosomal glucosylceramidase
LGSLQLDFDGGAPPEQAWRRKLNSHANLLKEFSVTFMEAMRMVRVLQGFDGLCWLFTTIATPNSWFLLLTSGPAMWKFQMTLGMRLWSYVREEASHGRVTLHTLLTQVCFKHLGSKCCELMGWSLLLCLQKAPIDPFTKECCKPSASQGVPLGGMGCVSACPDVFASLTFVHGGGFLS